jgi:hypothetical protein
MTDNREVRAGSTQLPHDPTLVGVRAFYIDEAVIDFTIGFLADVGQRGFEGIVLWGGRRTPDGQDFEVVFAVAPKQQAARGDDGVLVAVDGDELFRVNADFYRRGLLLCAQVHSHPGDAYHSDTDDAFAVVTISGGLSLVVPWYARHGIDAETTAVYRLSRVGEWVRVRPDAAVDLIFVTPSDEPRDDDGTSTS